MASDVDTCRGQVEVRSEQRDARPMEQDSAYHGPGTWTVPVVAVMPGCCQRQVSEALISAHFCVLQTVAVVTT